MARLTRLRFVSIGHRLARFHDVTLDFRGPDQLPRDSTLWLRNGGGKSSILNLFFALVRPHKAEFLGVKADGKARELDDYIQVGDRSVVASEWMLDGGTEKDRLLAGAFYERKDGTSPTKVLFFSARVAENEPHTLIESLPLFAGENGVRTRRTWSAFRDEWRELKERRRDLQVTETEKQSDWADALEKARIDPGLFAYQVKMNLREGGADELFRFPDAEAFIDFLLELTLDPRLGNEVSANIVKYKNELVDRRDQVLPEKELVETLTQSMREMVAVRDERQVLVSELSRAKRGLDFGGVEATRLAEAQSLEAREFDELAIVHHDAAQTALDDAQAAHKVAASLRHHLEEQKLRGLKEELTAVGVLEAAARKRCKIWEAADPLWRATLAERRAAELQQELNARQADHAPLLARVADAATAHAAAVRNFAGEERRNAARAIEEAKELRAEAEREKDLGTQLKTGAATLAQEARGHDGRIEEATRKRAALIRSGTLRENESGVDATARWEGEQRRAAQDETRKKDELSQLDGEVARLDAAAEDARERADLAKGEREEAVRELQRYTNAATEIAADAVLKSALQLEALDADALNAEAVAVLERTVNAAQRAVLELRGEVNARRRDVLHIQEHALLAPDPDVASLVGTLRGQLGNAWSGWEWFALNSPESDALERVRKMPHVATGIVVRSADLDAARRAIETLSVPPRSAVVIVSDQTASGGADLGEIVAGPGEPGLFSRSRAQLRLAELNTDLTSLENRSGSAEGSYRALVDARARLVEFRKRFPPTWLEAARARVTHTTDVATREAATARAAAETLRVTRERRPNLESEAAELSKRMHQCALMAAECSRFRDDHELPSVEWAAAAKDARARAESASRAAEDHRARAVVSEAEAATQDARARTFSESARVAEEELASIRFARAEETPTSDVIEVLRDRYRQLLLEYERGVGADASERDIETERARAIEERRRVTRLLSEGATGATEPDVAEAIAPLRQSSEIDEARGKADAENRTLFGRLGSLGSQVSAQKQATSAAKKRCEELGAALAVPAPIPSDLGQAINENESRANVFEGTHAREKEMAAATEAAAAARRSEADRLSHIAKRVAGVLENFADLLDGVAAVAPADGELAILSDDAATAVETQLRRCRVKWQKLDSRRSVIGNAVRLLSADARYTQLKKSTVPTRFRDAADTVLEAQCAEFATQLDLRAQQLGEMLAEIDKHREILVDEVLAAADDGLEVLRLASNNSRIPEHLPGYGGKHFLRISTDAPADRAERRARVSSLVEEAAVKEKGGGLALVQMAVKRLARPAQVRVLHPDPALEGMPVSIEDMARFSGGEQLTGAVLLYCTLARLRAARRGGELRGTTSVLLLDNPIGRVSRPKFLELQREMAQAMGVQLIYATGINDHEALRVLPNILRLRNERIDRRSKHRLVEAPDAAERSLDVVRIGRTSTTTDGSEQQGG